MPLVAPFSGTVIVLKNHFPFGEEVTPAGTEALKFTGHERDAASLDYMHVRYYATTWGRFLSVDPGPDHPERPLRGQNRSGLDGYQGVVIVSDGEPQPMVLVDIRVGGSEVAFDAPGKDKTAWTFSGRLADRALTGTIRHAAGGVEKVVLKRGCGYWDR